jgi:hypothetical protein
VTAAYQPVWLRILVVLAVLAGIAAALWLFGTLSTPPG